MPAEGEFTQEVFEFLKELRTHNDRDWFQPNKERYENQVRKPFLRLIGDPASGLKKINPSFVADRSPNGGSMMRIYRDIRLSNDKSSYKIFAAAHFWYAKGKEGATPAYYLHLEPGASVAGGGIWQPQRSALKKVRDRIVADPKARRRVTSGRVLGSPCTMTGGSLKRPPAGYDANHPLIEDIKRKDFAISSPLTDSEVCGRDFKDLVRGRFCSTAPLLNFLSKAIGLCWFEHGAVSDATCARVCDRSNGSELRKGGSDEKYRTPQSDAML